jgi:hypothetical protein
MEKRHLLLEGRAYTYLDIVSAQKEREALVQRCQRLVVIAVQVMHPGRTQDMEY